MHTKTSSLHRHGAHHLIAFLALLLTATGALAQQAGTSPVKIFILAGQSNMLGTGEISPLSTPGTLEYTVANDPGGDYQFLVDGGGSWVVRDDVWIRDQDPSQGGLTVGYGAQTFLVGPELGFGHLIGDLQDNQVFIVKAAWGGKSLGFDFLPPSSESYPTPTAAGDKGFYYAEVLRLVNEATTNLGTYFTDYDGQGFEIVGFGWHQGWNDRIDGTFSAAYEANMANFIRDIRTDLGVPDLPFVIATTGMDGGTNYTTVELAQLAMANTTAYPEFDGNVAVVDTRTTYEGLEFWQPVGQSPQDQGFHWNRNAKTYVNIGLAMADAMSLMEPGRCPYRPRTTAGPGGVTLSWQNGTDTPASVRILRNGVELAAAAPADPPGFLDATAEPGVLNYELQFTMPGDPCDPLTVTLDGGISNLELAPGPGGFVLTWTNNMAYDAIEVRRDGVLLTGTLSGTATTYTDTSPPGSGQVTYTVSPTTGNSTPATVQINLDLSGQLGILDLTANGGINPNTGVAWQAGDQYRLAFHTVGSTGTRNAASSAPADYNTYVTAEAHANASLAGTTWKAMVSTTTTNVKANTGTSDVTGGSGAGGAGLPVYVMDGTTCIARNNADIWNGWSNPFDGDSTVRTGTVHYSPFLDQFGNQTVNPDANHGITVATGADMNGNDVSPLGGASINTGSANANNAGRIWNRFGGSPGSNFSYYALSDPLTVVTGADTTPPTVLSFEDDKSGGPVLVAETVTYTVTFSEPMNAATVDTTDFANASATAITIDSVSGTADPAVFEVVVTPSAAGTIQLRVAAGATLEDPAGNALVTGSASPDNTIITVNADITPPTLNSFVDDVGGGPIFTGDSVSYTVTFSEAMNAATVGTADFGNAGTAAITVDSVSPTGNPAVFQVGVTATGPGTLQLRSEPAANLEDLGGNALDAGSASPDNTIITVDAPPALVGELGILDLTANGGINPNTGNPWQAGDQYRLAFHTAGATGTRDATSNDPADYNAYVTAEAHANLALAGPTWFALVTVNLDGGTTEALSPKSDPRVISGTDDQTGGAGIGGAGVPVYAMDGATCIARNNADIWNAWSNPFDGNSAVRVTAPPASQNVHYSPFLDQFGNQTVNPDNIHGIDVATGTNTNGTPVNPLGNTTDNTTINRGNANANSTSRVWNRFTNNTTDTLSYYALSEPLTVMATANDYTTWAALYPGADLTDPDADYDNDGLTNNEERVWGLDPTSTSSLDPFAIPLDVNGTFSYTRRDPSLGGWTYTVWTSTTLQAGSWVEDTGAGQVPGAPDANGVETVAVTLSPALLAEPTLFVRIQAAE